MDDSVLFTYMQEQGKLATKNAETLGSLKTAMEDMNKRLFGNGQPGVIQTIHKVGADAAACASEVKTDLATTKTAIDNQRKLDKRWFVGAFSVLTTEAGLLGVYFHYLAQHAKDALQVVVGH